MVAACAGMAQLKWLQVNLDCWRLRYESLLNRTGGFREGSTINDAPICPPEAFFAQLDLPVLAQRLKTEVPTLQGMRVKLQDLRGRERDMVHLGEQFPPDAEWDRLDRYREFHSLRSYHTKINLNAWQISTTGKLLRI